jgi:AAA domain
MSDDRMFSLLSDEDKAHLRAQGRPKIVPIRGEQVEEFDLIKPEAKNPGPRIAFETVAELRTKPEEEYLIDGWIPLSGPGLLFGRWGTFKSFVGYDIALHLAFGLPDWHGVKLSGEPMDVLIVAREGHQGFVKRIDAFKQHHGLTDDPPGLLFMRSPVSFLDNATYAELLKRIGELKRVFPFSFVDTVGRVLPGAEMGKEAPITMFMERMQQLGEVAGGVVIGAHHENKVGDANGSMFFQNNSDFMFQLERAGSGHSATITCVKAKDGEDGWSRTVTLKKIELPNGKSSLVVESISDESAPAPDRQKKSGWTKALKTIRQAIDDAVLAHGRKHRVGGDGPEVNAVDREHAREAHKRFYLNTGDEARAGAERQAWSANLKKAHESNLIGTETLPNGEELVWVINEGRT